MGERFGDAKHYTFAYKPVRRLRASELRRVARAVSRLDYDGPQEHYFHPDGCNDVGWRHPICTREQLEQAMGCIGVPYAYLMVPEGRDHTLDALGRCPICERDGPLHWGDYCNPILTEDDWVHVDPMAVHQNEEAR